MTTCPKCGNENRDIARFCQHCSGPLVSELLCPQCHTPNPVQARFCLNCAAPLRGSSLPTAPNQPAPAGLTGLLPPKSILAGRYIIESKLGKGGMGAVYLVSDGRLTGKKWALKEMSDAALLDPAEKQAAIEAFRHEATLLASLNHINLTRVTDFFQDNNKYYLVMDLVEGQTLEDLLEPRSSPFPEQQVVTWGLQICEVLDYLHHQNPPIIFRDLKPANIMLDKEGHIRLIDFGVARIFKPGKIRDTAAFGTAGYAPPEQYGKGQTDARSDVYALGATLHQLLTLRDPADTPFKFLPPRSINPAVSPQVSDALVKAVNHDQAQRWSSAAEFGRALQGLVKPSPTAQPSPSPAPAAVVSKPGTLYDVVLTDSGQQKIEVIKVIRQLTTLGLVDAKTLADNKGSKVLSGLDHGTAMQVKRDLQSAGATVFLLPVASQVAAAASPAMAAPQLAVSPAKNYQACPKCGINNNPWTTVCMNCGAALPSTSAAPAASPPSPPPAQAGPAVKPKPATTRSTGPKRSGFYGYLGWSILTIIFIFIIRLIIGNEFDSDLMLLIAMVLSMTNAAVTKRPTSFFLPMLLYLWIVQADHAFRYDEFTIGGMLAISLTVEFLFLVTSYRVYTYWMQFITFFAAFGLFAIIQTINGETEIPFIAVLFFSGIGALISWGIAKIFRRI